MITNTDLEIYNKSYTAQDFQSIYPQLLDLVKTLTNRWDPSESNESDPGTVLLKLAAFVADKNDYKIDKNILEMFIQSATQETSVRNIAKLNGYAPKHFMSGSASVSFTYNGKTDYLPNTGENYIRIPAYTRVGSSTSTAIYTLLEDVILYRKSVSVTAQAIEGTLQELTVGDSNVISLDNIDSLNRIYFPSYNVAENSVIIKYADNTITDTWTKLDLISLAPIGSLVYSFGYNSEIGLPYIQFPDDIASMLDSGITISYALSSGENGNILADTLDKLVDTTNIYIYNSITNEVVNEAWNPIQSDNIIVSNPSAVTSGSNPETIEEIYNNYQKVVGTFKTLVSCRDYSNYIYTMTDPITEKYLVSNVVAADRRTDFNFSYPYITQDTKGDVKVYNTEPADSSLQAINPYNLVLYPLQSFDKNAVNVRNYTNSFKPMESSDIQSLLENEDESLDAVKCLSHEFIDVTTLDKTNINNGHGEVYCFKNYYKLNVIISTYKKVFDKEQKEIINNVKIALMQNFNPRQLDYGQEIPRDILMNVIQNADSRIKSISLSTPEITPYVMYADGTEEQLILTDKETNLPVMSSAYTEMIVKNVLQGTINLFDYQSNFAIGFGTAPENYYTPSDFNEVYAIGTETILPMSGTLTANEQLVFIGPKISTEVVWPVYVSYRWMPADNTLVIPADTDYMLKAGDVLQIYYLDSEDVTHTATITSTYSSYDNETYRADNNIIRPNFDLESIANSTQQQTIVLGTKYNTLTGNQKIEKRQLTSSAFDSSQFKCYWITNTRNVNENGEEEYILFNAGDTQRILDVDEYFIYTNTEVTTMSILGPGTVLLLQNPASQQWIINSENVIDQQTLFEEGLTGLQLANWSVRDLSINPLLIADTQLVTLGEGVSYTFTSSNSTSTNFGNTWTNLNTALGSGWKVEYIKDGVQNEILPMNIGSGQFNNWLVRSRLNIDSGPNHPQALTKRQLLYIWMQQHEDDTTKPYWRYSPNIDNIYFEFSDLVQKNGTNKSDINPLYDTGQLIGKQLYNLVVYEKVPMKYENDIQIPQLANGTYKINTINMTNNAATTSSMNTLDGVTLPVLDRKSYVIDSSITAPILNRMFTVFLNRGQYDTCNYYITVDDGGTTSSAELSQHALFVYNDAESYNNTSNTVELVDGLNVIEFVSSQNNYADTRTLKLVKVLPTGTETVSNDDALLLRSNIILGEMNYIKGINNKVFFGNNSSMYINDINAITKTGSGDNITTTPFDNIILQKLKSYSTSTNTSKGMFNYLNQDSSTNNDITASELFSYESLFDVNNVVNRITLAEIDFGQAQNVLNSGSTITIAAASKARLN